MAEVFISYSRRDGEFVRELHGFLTGAGRDVWVDWEDIPAASKWQQDIDDSIDAAESLVFVISASSLGSDYCAAELKHAGERGKRIVPIAIDGARPDDAPPALRERNWIWCRGGDDRDAAFAALGKALDTDLDWARAHTRLLVRAVEWDARKDASLLLRGKDLGEVERVLAANGGKDPRPTDLQEQYVHASRRSARRRGQTLLSGVTIALAVSIVLGVLALLQRNDARTATRKATSVALSSTARLRVASTPDQALLLALAAYRLSPSAEARGAAFAALQAAQKLGVSEFLHGDSEIRGLAVAPNGRTLVTGSADGAVRLWDIAARKTLAELSTPGGSPVVSVGFARNGRLVAAGSEDGKVRLWDVPSGRPEARTLDAGQEILATAVSADGQRAAAIDGEGLVWLWNVATGESRRLSGPEGDLAMLAFSPDGQALAAGASQPGNVLEGFPGAVRVWDLPLPTGGPSDLLDSLEGVTVYALAFAPHGRRLAIAGFENAPLAGRYKFGPTTPDQHGVVLVGDLEKPGRAVEAARSQAVKSVAFAPDGRTIAAGLDDGTIEFLRSDDLKPTAAGLHGLAAAPAALAFGRGGHSLAAVEDGGTSVRLWSLDDREAPGRLLHGSYSTFGMGVAVSPKGATVAVPDGIKGVALVPSRGGSRKPRRLDDPSSNASVDAVAYSGDGSTLAASSDDGSIEVWDVRSGDVTRLPPRKQATEAEGIALDRDGGVLAAWDVGGNLALRLLRPAGGSAPAAPPVREVVTAAFVPGGALLVVTADGSVRSWDVTRGRWDGPARRPVDFASPAAISANGRTVAFADEAGRVWLWDRGSGTPAADLSGFASPGASLALSRDGRTLAVSTNQDVQLWDASSRTPLGEPLAGTASAEVAYTPDGAAVFTGAQRVRRWDGLLWSDAAGLRSLVCSLVVGDLTRAEWAATAPGLSYRKTCG